MTLPVIVLPYGPSVNEMYADYRGRRLLTQKGRKFKSEAGWLVKASIRQPLAGDIALTLRVYRPRKSGDLDNRIKAVQDALTGVAYADDKQIVELHAYRFDDKDNPRIEVLITCIAASI